MMTWRRGDLRDELVWELDRHGMTLAVPSPTLVTSVTRVTPGQPPWIPTLPTPWVRDQLKSRTFAPLPVRERLIPKPNSSKLRRLGIPTAMDRVVQASLVLVLEPIFEADFKPVSYGFRPGRRTQDAIAEIHALGSHQYLWVFEADIAACFDELAHSAVMDRVRRRIADKRVLALIKAFLTAGIMAADRQVRDSTTGTPQGGLCVAEHNPPYAQCRVMRSAGVSALVGAGSAVGRCA